MFWITSRVTGSICIGPRGLSGLLQWLSVSIVRAASRSPFCRERAVRGTIGRRGIVRRGNHSQRCFTHVLQLVVRNNRRGADEPYAGGGQAQVVIRLDEARGFG